MTNKQLSVSVLIIVLLVVVLGGVVYFRNSNPIDDSSDAKGEPDDISNVEQKLVVTHAYDGTSHEYTGSIVLPTPCYTLDTTVDVAESFPEQITINIATVEPKSDVICIQVLERATFDVFVEASEGANLVRVVLDGKPIDFEVFQEFKG